MNRTDRFVLLHARIGELERAIDEQRAIEQQQQQKLAQFRSDVAVLTRLNQELKASLNCLNQENKELNDRIDLLRRCNSLLVKSDGISHTA